MILTEIHITPVLTDQIVLVMRGIVINTLMILSLYVLGLLVQITEVKKMPGPLTKEETKGLKWNPMQRVSM